MILHIVKSNDNKNLENLKQLIDKNNAIILIEDGVYYCQFHQEKINYLSNNYPIFALKDDLMKRKISLQNNRIKIIGFDDFVDLTCQYHKTISWF